MTRWQIVVKFNIPLFYRYFYNNLSNYTKTIIRLRLVNIGEYCPRLRLGEYSPEGGKGGGHDPVSRANFNKIHASRTV